MPWPLRLRRTSIRERLEHLLELGRWPNVSVRIVLRYSGAHLGQDGPTGIIGLNVRDAKNSGVGTLALARRQFARLASGLKKRD